MTGALGFIGLGRMGSQMSARLAAAGHGLVAFDVAGTAERAPEGAQAAASAAAVASACETIFLSLPDGEVVTAVADEIAGATPRAAKTVVDTSTIGIVAAKAAHARFEQAGIVYVDAPVSGGVAGARAGSLAMMMAAAEADYDHLLPLCRIMAKNCFRVGREVGQGQAMKLLNNFLSGTAMTATSEAIAFGEDHGLDMTTMLEVLNVSSGQNTATADKFPRRILTGTYDAGFTTQLIAKDVRLFVEGVRASGARAPLGAAVCDTLERVANELYDEDFSRIYDFVKQHRKEA